MKKIKIVILLILYFKLGYTQSLDDLFYKSDSLTIENRKYKLQNYDTTITNEEIFNTFINEEINKNPESVFYYFGYDTITDFLKDKDSLIANPNYNLQEILRNFKFIDIDNDDDLDIIFNRLNYYWDFQSIYLYINENNKYKKINIPGFIITDITFDNNKIKYIKTFQWSCCNDPYNHYKKFSFQNDTIKQEYYLDIPTITEFPKEISRKEKFILNKDITYSENIKFSKGQKGQILAEKNNLIFVELFSISDKENCSNNKIWCWISREKINILEN